MSVRAGNPSDTAFIVEMARLASVIEDRPLPPADDPKLPRGLSRSPDTAVLAVDHDGHPVGAAWWTRPSTSSRAGTAPATSARSTTRTCRGSSAGSPTSATGTFVLIWTSRGGVVHIVLFPGCDHRGSRRSSGSSRSALRGRPGSRPSRPRRAPSGRVGSSRPLSARWSAVSRRPAMSRSSNALPMPAAPAANGRNMSVRRGWSTSAASLRIWASITSLPPTGRLTVASPRLNSRVGQSGCRGSPGDACGRPPAVRSISDRNPGASAALGRTRAVQLGRGRMSWIVNGRPAARRDVREDENVVITETGGLRAQTHVFDRFRRSWVAGELGNNHLTTSSAGLPPAGADADLGCCGPAAGCATHLAHAPRSPCHRPQDTAARP